MESIKTVQQKK